jgi:hypothetical protein
LFNFAENADERYAFASEADVAAAMARAEARGELRFSGYMLHYVAHGDSSPA